MKKTQVFSMTLSLVIAIAHSAMAQTPAPNTLIRFAMQRSVAASGAGCIPHAAATVTVKSLGEVEVMNVDASGLPPNTGFDLFVIQVPNAPFGLAWYQGDMESNSEGRAQGTFIGRFNEETFIVAPGTAVAPVVHDADASTNPITGPVHTFHIGLWFNSPEQAAAAGCPATVTPFNGEHNAGIQALSTTQFPKDKGPLRSLKP
jgi:hypothetical protein